MLPLDLDLRSILERVAVLPRVDCTRFLRLNPWQLHCIYFGLVVQVVVFLQRAELLPSHLRRLAVVQGCSRFIITLRKKGVLERVCVFSMSTLRLDQK